MSVNIPFATIDWNEIPASEHKGEKGSAYWRTIQYGDLRIRMVEYAPGYKADSLVPERTFIIYCIKKEK